MGFIHLPQNAQLFIRLTFKLGSLVSVKLFGHIQIAKYPLFENGCDYGGCGVWNGDGILPSCEVVYDYQNPLIPSRAWVSPDLLPPFAKAIQNTFRVVRPLLAVLICWQILHLRRGPPNTRSAGAS